MHDFQPFVRFAGRHCGAYRRGGEWALRLNCGADPWGLPASPAHARQADLIRPAVQQLPGPLLFFRPRLAWRHPISQHRTTIAFDSVSANDGRPGAIGSLNPKSGQCEPSNSAGKGQECPEDEP